MCLQSYYITVLDPSVYSILQMAMVVLKDMHAHVLLIDRIVHITFAKIINARYQLHVFIISIVSSMNIHGLLYASRIHTYSFWP